MHTLILITILSKCLAAPISAIYVAIKFKSGLRDPDHAQLGVVCL